MADLETVHDTFDHTGLTGVGGGSSALLAVKNYTSGTTSKYTTTSTTFVDIDATNVKVDFTAPASGNVLIRFEAQMDINGGNVIYLNVHDGAGIVGASKWVTNDSATQRFITSWYITGASGSESWKFQWRVLGGTGQLYYGSDYGSIVITVEAAP